VLLGELGRDELIVLLFRDRRNDGFYHAEPASATRSRARHSGSPWGRLSLSTIRRFARSC
jgi:hypothetical protein